MKQIIRIKDQNSRFPVDVRELHRKLRTGSRFNDWISRRINQYGFKEGLDYSLLKNEYLEYQSLTASQNNCVKNEKQLNVL